MVHGVALVVAVFAAQAAAPVLAGARRRVALKVDELLRVLAAGAAGDLEAACNTRCSLQLPAIDRRNDSP